VPLPGVDCALSVAPDHPDLKVIKHRGMPMKVRKTYRISGISNHNCYSTFNNTIDAAECAVKERVFFVQLNELFVPPPQPIDGIYSKSSSFDRILRKNARFTNPMDPLSFAESYRARKRTLYTNAANSLKLRPISRKDAYVNAFLKFEKYDFIPTKRKVPRIISPRGPRFNVSMGRFLKPVEKKIYSIINNQIYKSPTILKGMNQEERGRVIYDIWKSFKKPCALGIDAKRFDQHVSEDALRYEHSIYKCFHPYSSEFSRLCDWQVNNKCYINQPDGTIYYTTKGTRMSGDNNTSLGNCLLCTRMLHDFVISIPGMKLINDGDDCVLFFESHFLEQVRAGINPHCLKYGFTMEIELPVFELEHVEFCQSQPVYDGRCYTMIRNPHRCIPKDSISLKNLDQQNIAEMWLSAVGHCGLATSGGMPIFDSMYRCYIRASNGAEPLKDPLMDEYMWFATMGMNRSNCSVTTQARYSFWLAFNIPPDSQIAIEQYYDDLSLDSSVKIDRCHFANLPL
jgi:hypothetical protein